MPNAALVETGDTLQSDGRREASVSKRLVLSLPLAERAPSRAPAVLPVWTMRSSRPARFRMRTATRESCAGAKRRLAIAMRTVGIA